MITREWWEAHNDFMLGIYKQGFDIFCGECRSQTDLFYKIRNLAYENEEVKRRGISKEDVDEWESARYKYFVYPEKVKIIC